MSAHSDEIEWTGRAPGSPPDGRGLHVETKTSATPKISATRLGYPFVPLPRAVGRAHADRRLLDVDLAILVALYLHADWELLTSRRPTPSCTLPTLVWWCGETFSTDYYSKRLRSLRSEGWVLYRVRRGVHLPVYTFSLQPDLEGPSEQEIAEKPSGDAGFAAVENEASPSTAQSEHSPSSFASVDAASRDRENRVSPSTGPLSPSTRPPDSPGVVPPPVVAGSGAGRALSDILQTQALLYEERTSAREGAGLSLDELLGSGVDAVSSLRGSAAGVELLGDVEFGAALRQTAFRLDGLVTRLGGAA